MTEYKKLCALVAQLREDVTLLTCNFAGGDERDIDALHSLSMSIQTLVANAQPRMLKILCKAIETDPNRQIYNEAMCTAIKQLFEDFCEVVGCLFEGPMKEMLLSENKLDFEECPSISWVENVYSHHLLRRAQTESWQKRFVTNIADLVLCESETRAVYGAEQKQARETLLQAKRIDKASVQQILKDKEAAKWEAEVRRRNDEHKRLMEASKFCGAEGIEAMLLRIPEPFRKVLARNMLQLAQALRTTPEDPNIRRIRCNNMRVMMEYSHAAFCSGCQTCQKFVASAEVLWYVMGYQVDYSTAPTSSLCAIINSNSPILLPCGSYASEHAIAAIGFEDYSERFFTLCEPDPMQQSSEWMAWYATLEAVLGRLEVFLV
ncbi:putative membrane associated protein [Trypanosoma rangeli]|uniref:Putative membrane associated protein n=1 Tax=Trypanosoma rangeli TaxID=5698 RepID=A0A422N3D5_TRYRA|nr:putative membrane associated protein [Trypanosoma rangeli]RNE99960.1 putative membrane associated protein [Trypanosoma rangeli]|eukprot:RNE99960.1 putative membrane associated protein [Trypanosoma rangeli]